MINIHLQCEAHTEQQYLKLRSIAVSLGFPESKASGKDYQVNLEAKYFFKISSRNGCFWVSDLDQGHLMNKMSYEDFVDTYGKVAGEPKVTVQDLRTYLALLDAISEQTEEVEEAGRYLAELIADKDVLKAKIGVDE